MHTAEHDRLAEIRDDIHGWRRWGPYVADRAWATVREDYSQDGDAWRYLPHDLARSKAFRWGDDALAGVCDRYQLLIFAPAFWNGRDPFLKERLFGVTSWEGNHGEDVKEYYFHLDNTPTHSYMKFLYKYPQAEYPYRLLVEENQRRAGKGPEYELVDTGAFAENRYFDIQIEYAKADAEDLCIRIQAFNRGPAPATLHILPQLWFRNTWSWGAQPAPRPRVRLVSADRAGVELLAEEPPPSPAGAPAGYRLEARTLYAPPGGQPLFTENETNHRRVYQTAALCEPAGVKDAFHRFIVDGEGCLNPEPAGSKAGLHYAFEQIPAGKSVKLVLRLSPQGRRRVAKAETERVIESRRREADEFYESLSPQGATPDERLIQRQALAGLLWTKQSYLFDVDLWLAGDNPQAPPPAARQERRNRHWRHLNSMRVMTVPDKWEYPWFAAWDLALQCVPLALVDPQYAMDQLWVLLFEQFLHPNGQIPAYEWEFSDLNPPVHAWAVWRVYNLCKRQGRQERDFLERCFHKLLMNFAWWVNKVDSAGNNIFEGGFLGLDNITVADRSGRFAGGAVLEQSDATGWMGMFCLNLMRIALELAKENRVYEGLAVKFFQHYVYVAAAMKNMGGRDYQLWDEQDGFFYDVLRYPDGRFSKFRVRSLVGLIPLFAVERLEEEWIEPFHEFKACLAWFMANRSSLVGEVVHKTERNGRTVHVLSIVNRRQLKRLTDRLFDPEEFLSPFGIRSLSKAHQREQFEFDGRSVAYEPAEAVTKLKGGNSNWRGPIWFPTCFLLIESFRKLASAYGADAGPTDPTGGGGGSPRTYLQMAQEIADRLIGIFSLDGAGRRPVYGDMRWTEKDPHWKDLLLFFEYFHGDRGVGLGASHQTGWTALAATLIDEWRQK